MYWYCKNCGGMNYDDSKFCTHCGTVSEANESNNNMGAVASQQIINNSNHSNYNYNNNNSIEVAFLLILSATLISPFLKLYEISGLTSIFALFSRDSLDNMSTSFSMHDFYKSFTTLSHLSANGNFAEKFRPIGIALVL
ncbi:MAG: zinc ribbon domain-containing protein, partial [Ruminococcus sp.]|nr:zinc ribbon domain-containing protein [Ruminococcus sp.]